MYATACIIDSLFNVSAVGTGASARPTVSQATIDHAYASALPRRVPRSSPGPSGTLSADNAPPSRQVSRSTRAPVPSTGVHEVTLSASLAVPATNSPASDWAPEHLRALGSAQTAASTFMQDAKHTHNAQPQGLGLSRQIVPFDVEHHDQPNPAATLLQRIEQGKAQLARTESSRRVQGKQ